MNAARVPSNTDDVVNLSLAKRAKPKDSFEVADPRRHPTQGIPDSDG